MRIKVFFVSLVCMLYFGICYPLGWITMHEKADRISVAAAKKIAEKSNSPDGWYIYGLSALNEYKEGEAQTAFDKVLAFDPGSVEAKWGSAEIKRRKYETEASISMLEDIIKVSPQFSPAYISLAYIDFNDKKYDEAVRLSSHVIAQGKDNVDVDNYARAHLIFAGAKGMIAHNGGPIVKLLQGTQVFPHLDRARKLLPDSAQVYFGLGAYYLLAPGIAGGDLDKAQAHLQRAITLDPKLADAYVRLAQVYKAKGNEAKYEYYLKKALEIDPKNVLANDIKGKKCDFVCINSDR